MLEVCFNDSVKGALKLSKSFEDIAGVSLLLSEGDIKSPIALEGCPRKDCIYSSFSFDRYNELEDIEDSFNEFWQYSIADLKKLKSNSGKIRIWLDHTPDAQCGLLFTADLLKDSSTEIHIIELPERVKRDEHCEIEYHGWGEVEPKLFEAFLDREQILTYQETKNLSERWQILKSENAPLRVVENNKVISADIKYYDDLIRDVFPADACRIANIIGNALFRHKILTGDVFIAKRIQHFITTGELAVIADSDDRFYETVVRRAR